MVLILVVVVEVVTMEEVEQLSEIGISVLEEVILVDYDQFPVLYNESINTYTCHRWIKLYRRM